MAHTTATIKTAAITTTSKRDIGCDHTRPAKIVALQVGGEDKHLGATHRTEEQQGRVRSAVLKGFTSAPSGCSPTSDRGWARSFAKWVCGSELRVLRVCTPILGLFFLLLTGAGCSHDVSKHAPFRDCAGTTVTLQRPAYLWKIGPGLHYYEAATRYRKVVMLELDREVDGRLIAELPAGTPVRIESVKGTYWFGGGPFHALGQARPAGGEWPVKFEHYWGNFGHLLFRAPWESDDVPDMRYVGANGDRFTR